MRLAFATSVLVDPDVLILDEVFAVGDLNFQKNVLIQLCHLKNVEKQLFL